MSGAPLSIPAGVPSEGVLLRFWINFRFPNSVPVSGGGRGGFVRLGYIWETPWYPR